MRHARSGMCRCCDTALLSLEPREHSPAMGRICPMDDGAVAAALVRAWPRVIGKGPGGGKGDRGKGARGKSAKGQSGTGRGDGKGDTGCGKGDLDGWSPSSDNSPSSPRYLCRCMCGDITVAADDIDLDGPQAPMPSWIMVRCGCPWRGPGRGKCTLRCWGGLRPSCCHINTPPPRALGSG